MSRLKGGRSVQLRGKAFESEESRATHGLFLKWGVSIVFIAKALRRATNARVISRIYSAIDNISKRFTRGSQFTTMKQEKENVGWKDSECGKPRRHLGP